MACSCRGSQSGTFEVVTAEGTVPAQVNGRENAFPSAQQAQAALVASGVGGFTRQKR